VESIVYVDETGLDEYIYREYARAPRGEVVTGKISGKKYERTNILAGKCGDTILAPIEYNGKTDHALFEFWFVAFFLPLLAAGSVIVMDNASFHRKAVLIALAAEAGCRVIFLPPYSPDLNPIEKYWACLKKKIKKIVSTSDSLSDAIYSCFQS
jgi:transposase